MGKRSVTETIVEIFLAFQRQGTWAQAELARKLDLSTDSLRKTLYELMQNGVPLLREEDHPQVYWSVPKGWFPGGLCLETSDVEQVLRLLTRSPRTRARDRLMERIVQASRSGKPSLDEGGLVSPQATKEEEDYLCTVEDASRKKIPLLMKYYTSSRGVVEERHVSIHRVDLGRPSRFLAVCHRSMMLKWFRVDNLMRASLSPETTFLEADKASVEAFWENSIDGYHQGVSSEEHVFVVREPEARWVKQNLLTGMKGESCGQGMRVTVRTSAPLQVARFVVGLGEAAKVETGMLREMVRELAIGAMG